MIFECIILGTVIGIAIREALLIFKYGWGFEEKLRIYDRNQKKWGWS